MWYLKDSVFPDPSFQSYLTVISAGLIYLFCLVPYMIPAYRLASR